MNKIKIVILIIVMFFMCNCNFIQTTGTVIDECIFPCWQDIYPGITKWSDAQLILNDISSNHYQSRNLDDETIRFEFEFYNQDYGNEYSVFFDIKDNTVVNIIFLGQDLKPNDFQISNILNKYDTPDHIKISKRSLMFDQWEVGINLLYKDYFFDLSYVTYGDKINDNEIVACFENNPSATLYSNEESLKEFQNILVDFEDLSKVSEFTIQTFTSKFRDENEDFCLNLLIE